MDQSLLKSCLSNSFYSENKAKLRPSLFDDTLKEVYTTIVSMHDTFDKDLTPPELFSYWKANNPTSTGAWTADIQDLINSVSNAEVIDDVVAVDVVAGAA